MLMYHIVFLTLYQHLTGLGRCPAKYRRVVFSREVELELKAVCDEIELRYEIEFLEIGADKDHVHFLVQSVPMYSPTKIVGIVKSITAREIFARVPSVKKMLWGGEFWSKGYFMATVGARGGEGVIGEYVRNQGGGAYRRLDGLGGVQESLFSD